MLNKGDKCFVRIHTGEIVEAKYLGPASLRKEHYVGFKGRVFRASSSPSKAYTVDGYGTLPPLYIREAARFVCMPKDKQI